VLREEMSEVRSDLGEVRVDVSDMRTELTTLHDEVGAAGNGGGVDLQQRLEVVGDQLDRTLAILRDLTEVGPDQAAEAVEGVVGGVESFRQEVEELSHQLSDALGREEQLTTALETLTDEVQRLRKRIAVRAAPPTMDDEQIQTIVDAVVVAVQGRRPPSARQRPPEPAPDDEAPDGEAEPARRAAKASRKRTPRRAAARKAAARQEPDYEVDINEPFAPGELDVDEGHLDVEPEEEPIRRARGEKKKASKPLTKGRRTRSSSR